MQLVSKSRQDAKYSEAEWQVRVDLAAAHRMAVLQGFNEGIFNHLTATIPGKPGSFLVNPFGLYWSEVTASNLIEVDFDGKVINGEGEIERSAFCIHAPIHKLVPHAGCVLHTHMPYVSALTRLEDPQIEPIGQTEVLLRDTIAYDADYTGLANDPEEGARLAGVLGSKKILFMSNHGVAVVAETVAQAYDLLFYLERACQVQLFAMWTGQKRKAVKPETIEHMRNQVKTPSYYAGKRPYVHHFEALKRVLDRREPDYKE